MKKMIIENFKCFEYEEFEFENLTVLAGENGSGKSTLIQAILILRQTYEKDYYFDPSKYFPKEFHLNGYYFEGGTSEDILFVNAENDIIKFVFVNDHSTTFTFEFKIDKNARIIKRINEEIITSKVDKKTEINLKFFKDFDFISADRLGPQNIYELSNEKIINVGKDGEFTAHLIAKNKTTILKDKGLYFNYYQKDSLSNENHSLLTEINNWLSSIIDGAIIDAEIIDGANISLLKMTNYEKSVLDLGRPLNMPYGASYILPIIVSCLLKREDGLVIIENPEAHLHPSAQSKLGQFLAQMASTGRQIIIETHSEHIINGIRIAIKKEIIESEKVIFNYFSKSKYIGENAVKIIRAGKNGKLTEWPKGFFDQYELDMMELL